MTEFKIGERPVGPKAPCFVIAEAGINHNGSLERAKKLVDLAHEAGADAVKFQTFQAERLVSPDAPKARYQIENTNGAESQLEMLKSCQLSYDEFSGLFDYCRQKGILFLSTPFDSASLDFLVELGVPALKLGSGEVTNLPLLAQAARSKLPVILSTGMSNLAEVEAAVRTLRGGGCKALAVLHCTSNYPADPADANLRAMDTLAETLGVPIGYSDHTEGIAVSLASVACGAKVLEKHFTLDRSLPGPDHLASVGPEELKALVAGVRIVEQALGSGRKELCESEANTREVARRSLFMARDLKAGAVLGPEDLIALRPGTGIPPSEMESVCGRQAACDLAAGTMLDRRDLS